jgi:hypothetical protein
MGSSQTKNIDEEKNITLIKNKVPMSLNVLFCMVLYGFA